MDKKVYTRFRDRYFRFFTTLLAYYYVIGKRQGEDYGIHLVVFSLIFCAIIVINYERNFKEIFLEM